MIASKFLRMLSLISPPSAKRSAPVSRSFTRYGTVTLIVYLHQSQAMRRSRCARFAAVAAGERVADAGRAAPPATDIYQGAGHRPHHVAQEAFSRCRYR